MYLSIAVKRVESESSVRSRDYPSMMRFVEPFVKKRMMKSAMDKVDETVGKHEEQRKLQEHVPPSVLLRLQI